jgi:methylated-DNA-protein-cysteine methyltransferase-like protein
LPNHESREEWILGRIRAIPEGFVSTYGDIDPRAPRLVGRILAETDEAVPWHRVVRADGSIPKGSRQRALLLSEGVPIRGDRVDMGDARFPPEALPGVRRYDRSCVAEFDDNPSGPSDAGNATIDVTR